MLVIATAVPAVISVKNGATTAQIPKTIQASVGMGWIEEQKLLASDGAPNDNFGLWVDNDGDAALIGAWNDDDNGVDSGSVYVFTRTGTTWTQQAKLLPSDGAAGDQFGFMVAISGDTALVGANWDDDNGDNSGSVYVFTRTGTTWTQQQKLLASDGQAGDRFSLCYLDGDTALIGAFYDDDNGVDSGSAYIFTRSGTTFTQQAKLLPSDGAADDNFGFSAFLDGDTTVIGAWQDDDMGTNSGSAYVFTRSGTTWTQQAKLLPSDGAAGDNFGGYGLGFSGDTALIGALGDDDMGSNSGSAYVFTRTGTTWAQTQKITALDGQAGDNFGYCTSLSGDIALIGAPVDDDNGVNSGSAYVFTKSGTDLTFSIIGGLGVKAGITNDGTSDANDVPWQIHVEGGIFGMINKTVNGTVDIPAGDTVTVKTGILLGFGAISIIANVAGEQQTAKGTQLIIFSIVKK